MAGGGCVRDGASMRDGRHAWQGVYMEGGGACVAGGMAHGTCMAHMPLPTR